MQIGTLLEFYMQNQSLRGSLFILAFSKVVKCFNFMDIYVIITTLSHSRLQLRFIFLLVLLLSIIIYIHTNIYLYSQRYLLCIM